MTDLKEVKSKAKAQLRDVPGVQGFGIGDNTIRIYIQNSSVKKSLPKTLDGVTVETVVVGEIQASGV